MVADQAQGHSQGMDMGSDHSSHNQDMGMGNPRDLPSLAHLTGEGESSQGPLLT